MARCGLLDGWVEEVVNEKRLSLAIVPPKDLKKDVNHARRERSAHDAESELRRMRSLGHCDVRGRNHRKKGEMSGLQNG